MPPLPLSQHAQHLVKRLTDAEHYQPPHGPAYHVAGLGSGFYFAYEQLRNVAEYREHHLLLRSAIERYLARYVRLDKFEPAAGDMVTELTQSGYLKNDSVPQVVVDHIDAALENYGAIYHNLRGIHVDRGTAVRWLHQIASVHIEQLISPDPKGNVFMQFAFEHYFYAIDRNAAGKKAGITDHQYRIALFCAVQRAIFKSDLATTRFYCVSLSLPDLAKQPPDEIAELNQLIDDSYQAPVTNRLARLINRYGAPMRILRELIIENTGLDSLMANRGETLSRAKDICGVEYARTQKSLNGRIVKTIFFVFITKTLVGVSVEVPYDLFASGAIAWTPLFANIAFPLLYMATISARISTPSRQNTEVVAGYIDRILYQHDTPVTYKPKRRISSSSLNAVFSAVYAIGFIGSLALLVWILRSLGFNIVNGMIFFLFFSAVSFLGFRLRQSAHELAMLDEREGVLPALADFLSTPFVRVGHWLSDKYAKANFVTAILDLAIEMPIKTSLRMLRQWVSFMRDKQEEL